MCRPHMGCCASSRVLTCIYLSFRKSFLHFRCLPSTFLFYFYRQFHCLVLVFLSFSHLSKKSHKIPAVMPVFNCCVSINRLKTQNNFLAQICRRFKNINFINKQSGSANCLRSTISPNVCRNTNGVS